jgi:hypothetical protein
MRIAIGIAFVIIAVAPVRAEVRKLGKFALGQQVKRPSTVRTSIYGCAGELRPSIDSTKKVVKVRFSGRRCKTDAVIAAITKAHGRAPIVNAQGDQLWEGKTASVILSTALSVKRTTPIILLVPPGPGSKRTCWSDDGFAAFWSTFKASVASGKPATMAASFAFPVKDYAGNVKATNAQDLLRMWGEVMDNEDVKQIVSGELAPTCRTDDDEYNLSLDSTYSELKATKVRGKWRWSKLDTVSPD